MEWNNLVVSPTKSWTSIASDESALWRNRIDFSSTSDPFTRQAMSICSSQLDKGQKCHWEIVAKTDEERGHLEKECDQIP